MKRGIPTGVGASLSLERDERLTGLDWGDIDFYKWHNPPRIHVHRTNPSRHIKLRYSSYKSHDSHLSYLYFFSLRPTAFLPLLVPEDQATRPNFHSTQANPSRIVATVPISMVRA